MNILFTSGGTEEPIDGVRRISNTSTGRTGAVLARYFADRGARVTLIRGTRALSPEPGDTPIPELIYRSYSDLHHRLKDTLAREFWDAVVHPAAVSDYTVEAVDVDGTPFPPGGPGKIAGGHSVTVRLRPTAKILDSLRDWSRNPALVVVGFKLTDGAEGNRASKGVNELFARGGVDYVVHNDLNGIDAHRHNAAVWGPDGILLKTRTKDEMAEGLYSLLAGGNR